MAKPEKDDWKDEIKRLDGRAAARPSRCAAEFGKTGLTCFATNERNKR